MDNDKVCVGGDGGPLIVLQAAAIPQWQGAANFDNSIMGGGDVETDYDVICENLLADEFGVVSRYGREMLVLWDSENGAMTLPPHMFGLAPGTVVVTYCYTDADLTHILPHMVERVARGGAERAVPFHIQDITLRLQVGADGGDDAAYSYEHLDIPALPGVRQCDVYLFDHPIKSDWLKDMVVIINTPDGEAG